MKHIAIFHVQSDHLMERSKKLLSHMKCYFLLRREKVNVIKVNVSRCREDSQSDISKVKICLTTMKENMRNFFYVETHS